MAKRGGKRPGAGRPKGRKDKATIAQLATLGDLAKNHTATALSALVDIAEKGESEASRVAAANSILDRIYGKPKQAIEHGGRDGGPVEVIRRIIVRNDEIGHGVRPNGAGNGTGNGDARHTDA